MRTHKNVRHYNFHLNISLKLAERMTALLVMAGILFSLVFMSFPVNNVNANEDKTKTVRVGWFDSAYCYYDQLGRRSGLAYEYQQKLVAYTDWEYEYVDGTWPELYQMLEDGEIDLMCDVSYTKERAEKVLFPRSAMGSESYYIFIRPDDSEMTAGDIKTFEGKTFAADKGTIMESLVREWADENGISINLKTTTDKSVEESFKMLDSGEIDALVTVESYGERGNCLPVCSIGSSYYYFAVNKNRPDLLQDLNSALDSILSEEPYYNQKLAQKYIWSANTNTYLDSDELEWLSDHKTIRVGYRANYLPFCAESEGKLTGALADYLSNASEVFNNAHLEFEPVCYQNTQEALKALENGDVEMVFPIKLSSADMERMGLLGTEGFMKTEIFAVVDPQNTKDIFEDENVKVSLLEGNVNFDNFVQDYYPWWIIKHKPTLDGCYSEVAKGNVDCAMVNSHRITINDRMRRHYKLGLLATGQDMDFGFAIKRHNKDLYTIINKTIYLTDTALTEKNLSRYAVSNQKVTFEDYLYDNAISVLAITAIVFSVILFLVLARMRSDKRAAERQKLISATEHDELTGLYTRNYFFEYATRMHKEHPDYPMDAIVLNIEQFHVVNALYGWDYGDRVLKALGDEITAYITENDGIACRSTADRFDVYALHVDDHMAVYERFQKAIEEFSENVSIRIRMGIMPYQRELEPVELFDRARTACSMVRGGHQGRLMIFNEEMRDEEIQEQRLLNDLRNAIEHHEFLVYFQPKYDIQSNPPVLKSAEALVRWKHHEFGMIPPGQFIGLFEKHGQIGLIDKYVWNETARQIGEWKKKYGVSIPVSVNLSRVDIFDPDLVKTINTIVKENDIKREELHLEVTESAYTEDAEQIVGVVGQLRRLGYIIEMDDFGTGYSSLNMLSAMPVDILKLDKSFIDNLEKNGRQEEKDIRLVELILGIARSLKLTVVAEGVENEKQLEFLRVRGCEMVQGYYFSPPLPPDAFEVLAFKVEETSGDDPKEVYKVNK